MGRSVAEFLDTAGVAAFREGLESLESGGDWQGALRMRRSDGTYRHIAFRSRRMNLPDNPAFVLNHGMDMTEISTRPRSEHCAWRPASAS